MATAHPPTRRSALLMLGRTGAHSSPIRVLLVLALQAINSGCASFYLHDAATQKATDSAHSALDAVKLDAVFDSQSSYLDSLEKNEAAAITAKYAALRDQEILLFLDGTGPGGYDGLLTMKQRIDGYLLTLAATADRTCTRKLWRVLQDANPFDAPADADQALKALNDFEASFAQVRTEMLQKGNKCGASPFPALPVPATDAPLAVAIGKVRGELEKIKADKKSATDEKAALDRELSDAEKKFAAGKTDAGALSNALDKFKSALNDANPYVRKLASEELGERVGELIAGLGPEGTLESATTKQTRSTIAVLQALAGVGDANASPPRVPHPNALAATQSWLDYIHSRATDDLQSQQTLLGIYRAQLTASVATVYFLSKAGEEVQKITKQFELPKGAKYKCPENDDDLKNATQEHRDCGTKGMADLFDSPDGTNTRAIDGASLYYASAWTRGFAPNEILSRRGYIDQRRIKLASSRAAGAAWMGTLKPSVETLTSYGAGGFDPQVLAQLIQALGVGGIAAGVNR